MLLGPSGSNPRPESVAAGLLTGPISHEDTLLLMKAIVSKSGFIQCHPVMLFQANKFCLELAGKRQKLVGITGDLYLDHLERVSDLEGWVPGTVIDEWATHLDDHASLADTKVLQTGFFNQIRKNSTEMAKDPEKLERWWTTWIRGCNRKVSNCGCSQKFYSSI